MAKLGMWLDVILVSLLALVGIVMFVNSFSIPSGFRQVLGAGAYSRSVSLIFVVLCMAYLFTRLLRPETRDGVRAEGLPIFRDFQVVKRQLLGMWIAFILYLALIPVIGFFEAAFAFLAVGIYILGDSSPRWLLQSVVLSAVISIALFIVFRVFLHVYLPQRTLFRG